VIDLLDSTAKAQRVCIELSMAENIPDIVYGDKKRTRQIIFKLTSNAIKFSPNGCVVVAISCANENENDAIIQISIRDNGIGIDEAHLSEIFTVFKQADTAPNRKISGTDLGLSITKNLVGMMGGDINVQSELGSGSTFTVNLPFKKTGSFSRGAVFPRH
jgi:signal transduction histidine kinase